MSTTTQKPPLTAEQNVYANVYYVLLGGMFLSSALFAVGLIRALIHPQFVPMTSGWVQHHYDLKVIARGLATADPTILMLAATVVLILTPVLRVLISIYAFIVDRDYKYVAITSIVFGVIVLTVVLARFGLQ